MAVYVDNMRAQFRRMVMCHMTADTEAELHSFAVRLRLQRSWYQDDHYDISLSKRRDAVKYGAVEVTQRELAALIWCRTRGWKYKDPTDAVRQMLASFRTEEKTHGEN